MPRTVTVIERVGKEILKPFLPQRPANKRPLDNASIRDRLTKSVAHPHSQNLAQKSAVVTKQINGIMRDPRK